MSLRGRGNLTPVEIHRIEGKCGYPCLTPNALVHNIAVCSAQDALLGIESIYIRMPATQYSSMFCLGCLLIRSTAFGVEHAAIQNYPK